MRSSIAFEFPGVGECGRSRINRNRSSRNLKRMWGLTTCIQLCISDETLERRHCKNTIRATGKLVLRALAAMVDGSEDRNKT